MRPSLRPTRFQTPFLPVLLLALLGLPTAAFAQDGVDSGDTAWILTSTALVLFMTLPGLALFFTPQHAQEPLF